MLRNIDLNHDSYVPVVDANGKILYT